MKNIIDHKNNISISDFNLFSIKELENLFSINDNIEINFHRADQLEYITISDFLRYPEDVKKFLIKFPSEDRLQSIIEINQIVVNKAPGFQQPFNNIFFLPLSNALHKIAFDHGFCNYEYDKRYWDFYSNCLHSGMPSFKKNYLPHIDSFALAANLYLTDIEDTYTAFFKFIDCQGNQYPSVHKLKLNQLAMNEYISTMADYSASEDLGEWQVFRGNKHFVEYHRIPSNFNCISMYRGKFWHNVQFDATIPDRIRYSLVCVLK